MSLFLCRLSVRVRTYLYARETRSWKRAMALTQGNLNLLELPLYCTYSWYEW